MDAITLIKKDHRTVDQLFKKFEKSNGGDKKKLAKQIITELSIHAAVEEELVYPLMKDEELVDEDEIMEAHEEHHIVKLSLMELQQMGPRDEGFDAKVNVLGELVRHHVKEEESAMLPKLRKIGKERLSELAERIMDAKSGAPKTPQMGDYDRAVMVESFGTSMQ
ncbi:MAG TPA: hemerythrin domain-containing protein [Anaeromyxobacteraceae bacterium]|nr:hemerythrin domain-containing protein [Anaeromyxobacteraceae bacterium]